MSELTLRDALSPAELACEPPHGSLESPSSPSPESVAGPAVGETAGASRPVVQPDPLELTHRNHFRFGYALPREEAPRWFVPRPSGEAAWRVAYGPATREPGDFRAECIETARLIAASTDRDLWVLFSGGVDSEVVVQAFLFSGIPFRVAITRFRHDLNRHDIGWAIRFCEAHGVRYRLLDLDIERFFSSGAALDYAERARCVQPQLLHTMWAMDQVEGYPILGSGECYLARRPGPAGEWEMREKERIASWYRHLLAVARPGCAGFFQFTPEVMLAWLRDPLVVALVGDRLGDEEDSTAVKPVVYRGHFLLEPRPKYHGFEHVLHLDDALRPELQRRFRAWNEVAATGYAELVKELAP